MKAVKVLQPYEKEDIDFFFGREKETERLFGKVRRSRLTVLYGLSGTGKTSLVKCGLANRFHDTNWYELYVKRGGHRLLQSLREQIMFASKNPMPSATDAIDGLERLYLEHFRPIYIVFDQFEELFISGKPGEITEVIDFLKSILDSSQLYINVLLVMREEYLAYLDQFEEKVPTIFDNRMRLEGMGRGAIQGLIKDIFKAEGIQLIEEQQIIARIYNSLKGKKDRVSLLYLSVFLSRLFQEIEPKKTLRLKQVPQHGVLEDVVSDYLDEQVGRIGQSEEDRALIWKIFKTLTTLEGTKRTLTINEIINLVGYE